MIRHFRYVALAGLVGLLATPAVEVQTSHKPHVTTVKVDNLDAFEIYGNTTPNDYVTVWAKQRSFKEGAYNGAADDFSWCGASWDARPRITLGSTWADSQGNFKVNTRQSGFGSGLQITGSRVGGDLCAAGLATSFRIDSTARGPWEYDPHVQWMNVDKDGPENANARVAAVFDTTTTVTISVADGPDGEAGSDEDSDNYNLCTPGLNPQYCGGTVKIKANGDYDFQPPHIFLSPAGNEFNGLLGTLVLVGSGGSTMYMTSWIGRDFPAGAGLFDGILDGILGDCDLDPIDLLLPGFF